MREEKHTLLTEGYYTAVALMILGEKHNVELHVCHSVCDVLYEGVNPKTAINLLFSRCLKEEFKMNF